MFGINLKYLYPFVAAMIGSAIAAVVSVSSGVMANSIGVGDYLESCQLILNTMQSLRYVC